MPSPVATAFRDTVAAGLADGLADQLRHASGGGREAREMHRAHLLATRAARDWAGDALASLHPGVENRLERLPVLVKPEDGYHHLQAAAHEERRAALSAYDEAAIDLTAAAHELGEALAGVDTEATNAINEPEFTQVGERSGAILLIAGKIRDNEQWVVEQANRALEDLIDLQGWTNELGPRFDI